MLPTAATARFGPVDVDPEARIPCRGGTPWPDPPVVDSGHSFDHLKNPISKLFKEKRKKRNHKKKTKYKKTKNINKTKEENSNKRKKGEKK